MNKFVIFINKLNDMDSLWYPFLFLRPKKNEFMTAIFSLKVSVIGSIVFTSIFSIILYLTVGFTFLEFFIYLFIVTIITFILFSITAVCWNIRAKLLKEKKRKPEQIIE